MAPPSSAHSPQTPLCQSCLGKVAQLHNNSPSVVADWFGLTPQTEIGRDMIGQNQKVPQRNTKPAACAPQLHPLQRLLSLLGIASNRGLSYTALLYTALLYTAPLYTAPLYTALLPLYTALLYTAPLYFSEPVSSELYV